MLLRLIFTSFLITGITADPSVIVKDLHERRDLEVILIDLINSLAKHHEITCVTFVCDTVYLSVFEGPLFRRTFVTPYVMIVVEEYEDLLSPNFYTLESIRAARRDGCNVYVILLANGLQTIRLLRFGDRHRMLDTRAKYIMLHDLRLFHSELHYLWKRIVNVVFLKYHKKVLGILKSKAWFDISTVPFPNPIRGVFVPRRVDIWRNGRFHYNKTLFFEKTKNLNGESLNVVYLDHVPSVVVLKNNESNKIGGVEIEIFLSTDATWTKVHTKMPHILCQLYRGTFFSFDVIQILNTLASKMNFIPKLYQPINVDLHKWGQMQPNGSFSGLLGEMVNGNADMALGNLQYTPYHLELTDLSNPYTSQCWTFLTPEALTDNSWKTLILPFKLYMWIAVLLVLLITGVIFYGLAKYYMNLEEFKNKEMSKNAIKNNEELDKSGLYLFGEIINSILYTYGMLLVVSLPKLPAGWSIRLLTGWYWLYCILLVVSYRASMTAILANPVPRVTIDTLKELVDSKVTCGGWGIETKKFFDDSLDDYGQKIGERFEIINDPDEAARKVAQGVFAYYDNSYFLKYLSVKRKNTYLDMEESDNSTTNGTETEVTVMGSERNLHIMSDCVFNIPISIGFHKNSPLKPLADIYITRIIEVGLVEKWLNDAMRTIRSLDIYEDEVKALMNLKKLYGAFVALGIGYLFSSVCLFGEFLHWHLIVKRDPAFDKYALDLYYIKKRNKNM